jgi:hypothetical protein
MRQDATLKKLKSGLVSGQVYRRADLAPLSSNIDRHLAKLVAEGCLKKIAQGMYTAPKNTEFGEAPPNTKSLLKSFLKDDHFVVYGPSNFNALGLGTTQLYNRLIVFNRKRVGEFNLAGRTYSFHRWREAPRELTQEFLVVELLNRIEEIAEDRLQVLINLKQRLAGFNRRRLLLASSKYGTISTQKRLNRLLKASDERDGSS